MIANDEYYVDIPNQTLAIQGASAQPPPTLRCGG
jgi:hypothetical protein